MDDALAGKFTREKFQVRAGARALYREIAGAWKRWDPTTNQWV